jgi:hypothetical protein
MNLLISGDWHFSDAPIDAYRFSAIEKHVPALIKKHKIDCVLVLGDFTEAKSGHSAELVNRIVNLFHKLSELAPLVLLRGNHDWHSSPDNAFFAFLSRLEHVSWVGQPTLLSDVKNAPSPALEASRMILLPHTADYERDWGNLDLSEVDWAFCHQSFAGALSESGFKLPDGVPLSFFPSHLKIVSGDIHRPQHLGNLTYCGSPYSIDFGDNFEPRMLLLSGNKLTSLPCPGPGKRLVEVASLAKLGGVETTPGDILKVRVALSAEEAPKWAEIAAYVREWGAARKVYVHLVQPIMTSSRKSMTKAKGAPKKSDAELLKEYAAARAVGEDTLKAGLKFI